MYYRVSEGAWMMHRLLWIPMDLPGPYRIGFSVQSPKGKGSRAVFSDLAWEERAVSDFRWGR
jgi:hypothetical protein